MATQWIAHIETVLSMAKTCARLVESGVIRKPPMAFSEEINNLGHAVQREHDLFAGEDGIPELNAAGT